MYNKKYSNKLKEKTKKTENKNKKLKSYNNSKYS